MFSSWPGAVFVQACGKPNARNRAGGLVFLPGGAGDVAAHHAFDRKHLCALDQHRASTQLVGVFANRGWVLVHLGGDQMVGDDVGKIIEPEQGKLAEDVPLLGNAGGQNVVEGGDAIGGDKKQLLVADAIHVAHLAAGVELEIGEVSL